MHPSDYEQRNHKLAKTIIDYFGHRYFLNKRVLDLGCFNGELANAFARVGARVTAVDARKDHLAAINKKYPHITTIQLDLDDPTDKGWIFQDFEFDVVLSLGVMSHLNNFKLHLERICSAADIIVLETEVLDYTDKHAHSIFDEDKMIIDASYNGKVNIASSINIQNTLSELGATFKRIDETRLNTKHHRYDWNERNTGRSGGRRMWFVRRDRSIAQKVLHGRRAMRIQRDMEERARVEVKTVSDIILRPAPPFDSTLYIPTQLETPIPQAISTPIYNSLQKRFVIVIPSYKNERWCEKNIKSALDQNYNNFRIIFTDDCSGDATFDKTVTTVNSHPNANKTTLIKNTNRVGALENLYNMILSCDDEEIILTLDGDDWFPDNEVLNKLNKIYSENNNHVWMTYGQYKNSTDSARGVAQPYPDHIVRESGFRRHVWSASHLRTFYSWLFKRIRKQDLMKDGKFFVMTWDFAIMFPMLEMAGEHSKYLNDILYVYNLDNPINDHKVNVRMQHDLDRHIRGMARYPRTEKPVFAPKKTNVGLLMIATGKYHRFVQDLVSSADNFFLNDNYNITYYLFSDIETNIQTNRNIVNIHIDHRPFPFASMDRFRHFTNHSDKLGINDYLYYVDVDCKFVDRIGEEILGGLVGVRHCGFSKGGGPYERNQNSTSFVHPSKQRQYFGGGFSGGEGAKYLTLAKWCADMLDTDANNGIMPVWHDESILNRYFSDNPPNVILSPSYHYPQGNIERYKQMWSPETYNAKILLLDKAHNEIRAL